MILLIFVIDMSKEQKNIGKIRANWIEKIDMFE